MAFRTVDWLWLIPALPLLGALLNGFLGKRLGKSFVRVVSVVAPSAAFIVGLVLFFALVREDRTVLVRGEPDQLSELGVILDGRGWLVRTEEDGRSLRVSGNPVAGGGLDPEQVNEEVRAHGFTVRPEGEPPVEWSRALEVGWAGELAPAAYGCDLGPWISVGGFEVRWGFLLDRLSVLMVLVITGVGSLIHLYSTSYMDGEEPGGYARYFTYLNLFVGAMLVLVLGRDLLVMFIGWEGVGMCSYLLIGFHYQDRDNAACGTKAFVVNRIGDVGFVLGMLTLVTLVRQAAGPGHTFSLDALRLNELFRAGTGEALLTVPDAAYWQGLACLLLFIGATGKSAQIPLHLWLPDAMAGPTPVSALIHAATMVTAGVYMICRLSHLFVGAAVVGVPVLSIVAVVGVLTAFYAATTAIAQDDIKRVLAYSTVSQLGYMFVGVGAAAFGGAMFHLVTHAFFKALLFLGAGSVIHACHSQSMRQMGGLKHAMPTTFATMMIGAVALAGVFPLCGFFSKDLILYEVLVKANSAGASPAWMGIYLLGVLTALLTAVYTMRMIGMTFLGEHRGHGHPHESPQPMTIPLSILAVLSLVGGLLGVPHVLGHSLHLPRFPDLPEFVGAAVAQSPSARSTSLALGDQLVLKRLEWLEWTGLAVGFVVAIVSAVVALRKWNGDPARILWERPVGWLLALKEFLLNAWRYDEALNKRLAQPVTKTTAEALWRWVDDETIDRGLVDGTGRVGLELSNLARASQTGRLSRYAGYVTLGAVGLPCLAIFTHKLVQVVLGLGGAGH